MKCVAITLVAILALGASRQAIACYSCSTGECDSFLARTDCIMVYANGQWVCSLSGNWCSGGRYPESVPVDRPYRITLVMFVSVTPEADQRLFASTRSFQRVVGGDMFTSPTDLLASASGLSSLHFQLASVVLQLGHFAVAPRLRTPFNTEVMLVTEAASRPGTQRRTIMLSDGRTTIERQVIDSQTYVVLTTTRDEATADRIRELKSAFKQQSRFVTRPLELRSE